MTMTSFIVFFRCDDMYSSVWKRAYVSGSTNVSVRLAAATHGQQQCVDGISTWTAAMCARQGSSVWQGSTACTAGQRSVHGRAACAWQGSATCTAGQHSVHGRAARCARQGNTVCIAVLAL